MKDPYSAVWAVGEHDLPGNATATQTLRFALRYAILAPSGHNGQPWRFDLDADVLHIRAGLRPRLASLIGHDGYPQLLLRVGSASRPARVSPRRPLSDVLASSQVGGTGTTARPKARAVR